MAYTFLTDHPPGGREPPGLRGLPVTGYSDQFHALLQLQGMPEIAACFAIPVKGPHSTVPAWFTPLDGPVIPWHEANDSRKQQAIALLQSAFSRLQALRDHCLNSGYPAGLFYAELIEKIACFPGPESLWLAGNQPVITGWGYRRDDGGGAEEVLHQMAVQLSPQVLPVSVEAPPVCDAIPVTEILPEKVMTRRTPLFRRSRRRYPVPLMSGVLLTLLVVYGVSRLPGQFPLPAVAPPPAAAVAPARPVPDKVTTSQKPSIEIHLPRQPATLQRPVAVHSPPVTPQKPPPERLKIPEQAQKAGDIRFMDGRWFALLNDGGQSARLRFTYKNGQGSVVMTLSNNVRCQAKSQAGWLPSGRLSLRSRYRATCSNGRRQVVPDILCTRTGASAACTYADNDKPSPRPVILYTREPE